MTEPESGEEATLFPKTAGEKLREARITQGLSLAEVAARTRVPMRHLEAIEISDFSGLPSSTYSVGFSKAYARAVGLDEVMIGREVRGQADVTQRPAEYQPYEMNDPARLPPRGLATILSVVAVLIVIAIGIWYGTTWFRGEESSMPAPAPVTATAPAPAPPPVAAPAPPPTGQVVLTATDVVWLRVYDSTGKALFQGEMQPGDHFDVPVTADHPMINVGRPDKLQVTVNGSNVPPLGAGDHAIKDVEISAQALMARNQPAATTTPGLTPGVTDGSVPPAGVSTTPGANGQSTAPKPRHRRPAAADQSGAPDAASPEPVQPSSTPAATGATPAPAVKPGPGGN
jgi:cytoskeletal protein RodZ